jgi:hypothetical protein
MRRTLWVTCGAVLVAAGSLLGQGPAPKFSHERWDKLLKTYVTKEGWVDYARLQRESAAELRAYLKDLAGAKVADWKDRNEVKAFWINAYNAVCVQTLLDKKLPASVPKAAVFGTNIFTEVTYEVAGKKRSLDEIEHKILRPTFRDNRIHAAVVCGASSCPRLRPEAYAGDKLDIELDEECRSWINVETNKKGERKNYLDRGRKVFYVSKIFDWYEEDFGDSDEGILKFVQTHLNAEDLDFVKKNPGVRVKFLAYDWNLNKQ